MRNVEKQRQTWIRSAVNAVARDGMEHTTVNRLAEGAGMSESAMYRFFRGKDALLRAALIEEDKGFIAVLDKHFPALLDASLPWRERCWQLWKPVWIFILDPPDDCVFYIRYYYSENFRREAKEEHDRLFAPVRERLEPYFQSGRRVHVLLHQTFETMLSFAYRVMNGELPNDEDTCRMAFGQICNFLWPHFRPELLEDDL